MAAEELSPEEKLLKVIQGARKAEASVRPALSAGVSSPPSVQAPATAPAATGRGAAAASAPTVDEGEARGRKLKLAPPAARRGGEAAAEAAPAPTPPAAAAASGPTPPTLVGAQGLRGLRMLNAGLSVMVFLLLCLVAFEIAKGLSLMSFAGSQEPGDAAGSGAPVEATVAGAAGQEPSAWEDVVAVVRRDIMRPFETTPPPPPVPDDEWVRYVRANYTLVAVSHPGHPGQAEAMVRDRARNETLFVRVGEQIEVLRQTVRVTAIAMNRICFEDVTKKECCLE